MTKPDLMAELADVVAEWRVLGRVNGSSLTRDSYNRCDDDMDRLHAELEAVVRDAIPTSAWEALLPGTYYMDPPDGGDVSVYEQMRRMAKDAARYRHIKSAPAGTVRADFHAWAPSYYHWGNGKALDDQIDQAMHNSAREG